MDKGAWRAPVDGVAKSWTGLNVWAQAPCACMCIHMYIYGLPWWLSWSRIPLQCGRPGYDPWVGKMPWRREWLPSPVFWPGEFHELYRPWGLKVRHN